MNGIEDLEKYYFKEIEGIIVSEGFLDDLREIETYIQTNYDFLSQNWQHKNKLEIPVERLLRRFFYRDMKIVSTYNSVLSSDIAFYAGDALLNIDAKTIDMVGNAGDYNNPSNVLRNQITFNDQNVFIREDTFPEPFWNVLNFRPTLEAWTFHPRTDIRVPTLSYFIKFSYYDDGESFRLGNYALSCIPHNDLQNRFDRNIIQGYKTYKYFNNVNPRTDENIRNSTWLHGRITNSTTNKVSEFYFDTATSGVWKRVRSKNKIIWKKVNSVGTARIKDEKDFSENSESIFRRKDSEDNNWEGYREYNII